MWGLTGWHWAVSAAALGLSVVALFALARSRAQIRHLQQQIHNEGDGHHRLRMMLEQMPAVVWSVDRELRFDYIEGAGLAHLGDTPQTIVGRTIYEYFNTRDRGYKPIAAHEDALTTGKRSIYEVEWQDRTYSARVEPLRDRAGRMIGVVGAALDITARRLAEQALARAELRARALLTAIPDVMFRVRQDGTLLEFIDKFAAPATHSAGGRLADAFPPDIAQLILQHTRRVLETQQMSVLEYQIGQGAAARYFEARLVVSGGDEVLAILRNITARKQAENELRHRVAELRSLIKAIPDIILQVTLDGRLAGCVAENNDLLLTPDQCLGRHLCEVLPESVSRPLMDCIARAAKSSQPQVCQYTLEVRGDQRWFEARVVRVPDDNEQVLTLIRNITDSHLLREKSG